MDVQSRRARESSPDRMKAYMQPRVKPVTKVQVVYYLSRKGHLEHPHYMEVTHLAGQPLRLRDVTERLTVLRGTGMPSLYSWSCKRSYKSGYVWNDLAENDIIYPAEGAEYVLKGSEVVEGCSERQRLQQLQITNRQEIQQIPESNYLSKSKPLPPSPRREQEVPECEEYEEEEELEDGEKTSYTSSTTPHSHCSRGVSTDELEEETQQYQSKKNSTELTLNDQSHPATYSIDFEKANQSNNHLKKLFEDDEPVASKSNNTSKRFQAGLANDSGPSRNSVLLQLIACGSSAVAKSKTNVRSLKQPVKVFVRKGDSLQKGVLCKSAAKVAEEDMINIKYMSENPRFGNLQSEEKEYFSGSIVEAMTEDRISAEPVLKKSNSYNEERSKKLVGLGEIVEAVDAEKREKGGTKGKCIPRRRSSAPLKQTKK